LFIQSLYFSPVLRVWQVFDAKKMAAVAPAPRSTVVLGMGGTIAGRAAAASDTVGYVAGQVPVAELLSGLGSDPLPPLLSEQVAQIDSKDMGHAHWQTLAQRCTHWLAQDDVCSVVITHGTDTLEETAWFLQQVLHTHKPVVLTCAMRPATAVLQDGPQNLLDAVTVSRDPQARGVLVVAAGTVHSPLHVQKEHPYRLDAFSSGPSGPLAWVESGCVRWSSLPNASQPHAHSATAMSRPVDQWPWVAVVSSHAGADPRQIEACVSAGVQGLVVAGTGNGTLHTAWLNALHAAAQKGVALRLCTRCAHGPIVGDHTALPCAPRELNAFKARVSLMLDLMV
jgi:L-asparaginase